MKRICVSILMTLLATASHGAGVSPERLNELRHAAIQIDGTANPDAVPYRTRWTIFFAGYRKGLRDQLRPKISAQSDEVLYAYAIKGFAEDDAAMADLADSDFMVIGAKAESMTGEQLFAAFEESRLKIDKAHAARIDAVLNQLSIEDRRTIEEWAFETIRPKIVQADTAALAREAPDEYKREIVQLYQLRQAGITPEPGAPPPLHALAHPVAPQDSGAPAAAASSSH